MPLINRVPAGNPAEFTDLDYPVGIADGDVPAPANIDAGAARTAAAPTGAANDMFCPANTGRLDGAALSSRRYHRAFGNANTVAVHGPEGSSEGTGRPAKWLLTV